MSTNNPASPDDVTGRELVLPAFLLGWSISELLGHLRKGVHPPNPTSNPKPDYAPRLDVSDGSVESFAYGLLLSALRVVQFYRRLGLEPEDKPSVLTAQILALPDKIRDWLEGRSNEFYTQHDLRELLNDWSLQVWARLNGVSSAASRGLVSGLSLADTYWYLRPPSRRPRSSAGLSEEDWRRLLSKYRLSVEANRLLGVEPQLPAFTGPVIRRELRAWSIGTTLTVRDGKLVSDDNGSHSDEITPQQERQLQRALGRQVAHWESMLFGTREPLAFLHDGDRRWIQAGRVGGVILFALFVALYLIALALLVGYVLNAFVVPFLLEVARANNATVSDWLAVISLIWTVLIATPAAFLLRTTAQVFQNYQHWLTNELTIRFVMRRTYIRWDRFMHQDGDRVG